MASVQAKTSWVRLKKRKKKIIVLISFNPTWNKEFEKNSKKIQNIKKHHCGFSSSQNRLGKAEKERK